MLSQELTRVISKPHSFNDMIRNLLLLLLKTIENCYAEEESS